MTPTTVGLVLADGEDPGGTMLRGAEFTVAPRSGEVAAVSTSGQTAAAVLSLRTALEARGQRLRGIGMTWSGDATAEAALLFESLTDAGFDNVVPVRFRQAAESLADGVDPGESERAAVCMMEPGRATVLMMDPRDDDAPAVTQQDVDGDDAVVSWLTALFESAGRPQKLIVSGPEAGLATLTDRLQTALGIPVIAELAAQLTLARGAALALEPGAEFSDEPAATRPGRELPQPAAATGQNRAETLIYAGALTMLIIGVLTFVVSLSVELTLQLTPVKERPADPVAKSAVSAPVAHPAPVARKATPAHPPVVIPAELPPALPEAAEAAEVPPEVVPVVDDEAAPPADPETAPQPGY